MDPVTVIVAALAAGALKGVGDTASAAVKDAYAGLRSAVTTRFAGRATAEVVLAEHATDPDTYAKPLEKQVREAGLAEDPRIVELATTLLDLMKTEAPCRASTTSGWTAPRVSRSATTALRRTPSTD